ncbi:MAG TPA: FecR family protein [Polyangiaceae bacterium]|nr:FecR family protein [Polyangiaceae bacterium]
MSGELSPEEQALDCIVAELRAQPAPELDWDRIEARLMNQPHPVARETARGFFTRLAVPAVALLAVAAGVFLFLPRHVATPRVAPKSMAKVVAGPLNGDALALGTHVSSADQSVVVEHAGRARWTLEPHASAAVADAGEFLTVRLESGAISARVTPNPKPETFAVEVGGTRVAVHGTAFRVERVDDRVLVEVTEGVVAVEPTSTHSDPSFLLRRGSRGNFGLDGRTGSVEGNASVVVRDSGRKSRREIARTARPSAAKPETAMPAPSASASPEPAAAPVEAAPLQQEPSISDIESGVSSAVDLMNQCFQEKTQSSSTVSVSTGMTLSIAGDGSVQSVTFEPPLAPAVEDCGVAGLRNLTFARSVEGATFTRVLELKH